MRVLREGQDMTSKPKEPESYTIWPFYDFQIFIDDPKVTEDFKQCFKKNLLHYKSPKSKTPVDVPDCIEDFMEKHSFVVNPNILTQTEGK